MIHFIIYVTATGSITSQAYANDLTPAQIAELWPVPVGHTLLVVPEPLSDTSHYYVSGGAVVLRTVMTLTLSDLTIVADGVDECVISGLPNGASITVTGAVTAGPVVVTGGSLTLTSSTPGAITVRAALEPSYRLWETTINAT